MGQVLTIVGSILAGGAVAVVTYFATHRLDRARWRRETQTELYIGIIELATDIQRSEGAFLDLVSESRDAARQARMAGDPEALAALTDNAEELASRTVVKGDEIHTMLGSLRSELPRLGCLASEAFIDFLSVFLQRSQETLDRYVEGPVPANLHAAAIALENEAHQSLVNAARKDLGHRPLKSDPV